MNIYAKLTILCLFLVLFTAGVISYFADRKVAQTLQEEIASNMTQRAQGISSDIERFISSRLNDIRLAGTNPAWTSTTNTSELNTLLQELEAVNPLYYSFSLFDANQIRIANSKAQAIDAEFPNASLWEKLNASPAGAVLFAQSLSGNLPMLYIASTVGSSDLQGNSFILVGSVPVIELAKIVDESAISSDSIRNLDIQLIDENGTILYSNVRPSDILIAKSSNSELAANMEQDIRFEETGTDLFFISRTNDSPFLESKNWNLILKISKEKAYAPLEQIREQILWAVLPVILISILFALVSANFFVRPIVKLSKAAEELSKGNLDVEIPVGSKDEIGKLATQLQLTSQSLIGQIEEQRQMNKTLIDQKTQIEMQKNQLMSVSSQIRDSISYAERIQRATLPPLSTMQGVFPNSFVMYKPKDIIGGDFYWFERVRRGNNEFMIVACGDCTGHGVPGAIMSIMGSNQLTNIVYYQNYLDPKKIISRLDKVIKFELQRESEESNRDGMEIGICVIDLDTLKMEYSGAGIPLRIMKHGSSELNIYKSPRLMVGGIEGDEQEAFAQLTKETIQLDIKDRIFLSSDGFQDQFGGEFDKKYMSKNFNKLIQQTCSQPTLEQQKLLEQSFREWSKNTSQTDDICVLGFEVQ